MKNELGIIISSSSSSTVAATYHNQPRLRDMGGWL